MTDGEPETVVLASLQKIKLIKNPIKHFFYFIQSETSDYFDGDFAHLKTLDCSFNLQITWSFCMHICTQRTSVYSLTQRTVLTHTPGIKTFWFLCLSGARLKVDIGVQSGLNESSG